MAVARTQRPARAQDTQAGGQRFGGAVVSVLGRPFNQSQAARVPAKRRADRIPLSLQGDARWHRVRSDPATAWAEDSERERRRLNAAPLCSQRVRQAGAQSKRVKRLPGQKRGVSMPSLTATRTRRLPARHLGAEVSPQAEGDLASTPRLGSHWEGTLSRPRRPARAARALTVQQVSVGRLTSWRKRAATRPTPQPSLPPQLGGLQPKRRP